MDIKLREFDIYDFCVSKFCFMSAQMTLDKEKKLVRVYTKDFSYMLDILKLKNI